MSGTGHGQAVLDHEALPYRSIQEFVDAVAPLLRAGVDAGEPTMLAVEERLVRGLAERLGGLDGVTVLPAGDEYASPFITLRTYDRRLRGLVADGAEHIRVVGEVPHGDDAHWHGWVRYEAAINDLYTELPVHAVCPIDLSTATPARVEEVLQLHPRVWTSEGSRPNQRYREPREFLADRIQVELDPLEATPPALERRDPTPREARRDIGDWLESLRLPAQLADTVELAVHELVTNAWWHGRPPVRLRAWSAPGRVVLAVHDTGPGPDDPYAGYLPGRGAIDTAGHGLWIVNQLLGGLTLAHDADGFTAHLVVETAPHLA